MRWLRRRDDRPAWATAPERVLAAAATRDGARWLLGTRSALVVATEGESPTVWPWEKVQSADWDADERRLRVSLIGEYGQTRPVSTYQLDDPTLLLQLVRERITASVLYQRHIVPPGEKRGFRVIARRNPTGGEVVWMADFEVGVEPSSVADLVEAAMAQGRSELSPDTPI